MRAFKVAQVVRDHRQPRYALRTTPHTVKFILGRFGELPCRPLLIIAQNIDVEPVPSLDPAATDLVFTQRETDKAAGSRLSEENELIVTPVA